MYQGSWETLFTERPVGKEVKTKEIMKRYETKKETRLIRCYSHNILDRRLVKIGWEALANTCPSWGFCMSCPTCGRKVSKCVNHRKQNTEKLGTHQFYSETPVRAGGAGVGELIWRPCSFTIGEKYGCSIASWAVRRSWWSYRNNLSKKSRASGDTKCWFSLWTNLSHRFRECL